MRNATEKESQDVLEVNVSVDGRYWVEREDLQKSKRVHDTLNKLADMKIPTVEESSGGP